ncbi:hypothetical protein DFH08DRAFT_884852 [Mycena albidolilacea]|uniref:BTB domain-containing protein n=1 Tax=Mycena albidolilacea TaxID=1033008 RepID=A0AAD6ZKR7_9AGAR|nr:hypothetical protein DFH08DRAFT_884852 [Mycena albidolilacea]
MAVPDNYHPAFSDPITDVVLQSLAGTMYRVHSFTLRNTSVFFRTMLSLPQPNNTKVPYKIPISKKDLVLELGMDTAMMCSLELPSWTSFDEVEATLELIEKWDAPGPLSVVRTAITAPLFANDPLRMYGWAEESTAVLPHTLKLQLLSGSDDNILCQLSSQGLLSLISFHNRCKTRFWDALNGTDLFTTGNEEPRQCGCRKRRDNFLWCALKAKLLSEFECRPLGDHILVDMAGWPESALCWGAKCACGSLYYDQVSTVSNIKDLIKNAIGPAEDAM